MGRLRIMGREGDVQIDWRRDDPDSLFYCTTRVCGGYPARRQCRKSTQLNAGSVARETRPGPLLILA